MERQLRICLTRPLLIDFTGFFERQIKKQEIRIRQLPDDIDISHVSAQSAHEIDTLEETLKTNEDRLNNLLESKEILEKRHSELIELRHVLRETAQFFEIVFPNEFD